jgi:drug/metabolite transporter (DMT)-like permease
MESKAASGAMLAGTATSLIGSSVAAASLIVDYPVLTGQAVRYAIAAALLAPLMRRVARVRPTRGEWVRLVALAATGLAGFNIFLVAASARGDPAVVGIIVGCAPVALAVAGPLTRGSLPTKRMAVAATVVTAGAAVAQGGGSEFDPVVLLLACGALACEVFFSLLAIPLLPRLRPIGVSTYACAIAAGMLAAAALAVEQPVMPSATESLSLAYMAAAVTAGGFVFWYTGVDRLGVERAGLFLGLIPVSALLCVGLVGTGAITPLRVAGSIAVACGIVLGMTKAAGVRASTAAQTA